MGLIKCSECNNKVSDKATACPKCGNPNIQAQVKNPPKKRPSIILVLFLGFLAMGIWGSIFNPDGSSSGDTESRPADTSRSRGFEAHYYAKEFAKKRLKSPSTAKFPGSHDAEVSIKPLGGGSYEVLSWADSQNGFGATIRTRFVATVKEEGDQWVLVNLSFL